MYPVLSGKGDIWQLIGDILTKEFHHYQLKRMPGGQTKVKYSYIFPS